MHINPDIAARLAALSHPSLPGIDLSLARMQALLGTLGNPERALAPVIHVAGTNGKGSTIAYLKAMYQAAGYRVHAYTSPHLVRFNERIIIANEEISDAGLLLLLAEVQQAAIDIPVTFFEATTAAAFLAFARQKADVVLLETGLGGRLDATNVIDTPAMTVMTPIGLDHTEFLGPDIAGIAAEKAGILKRSVPYVSGMQTEAVSAVLQAAARTKQAPLIPWRYMPSPDGITVEANGQRWPLPKPALPGAHQYHNAALASVVAKSIPALPVSDAHAAMGISHAVWPGRLQQLRSGPLVEAWGARGPVFLDGAHNAHAVAAITAWIDEQSSPVSMLCGLMRRKDAQEFLRPFVGRVAQLIAVPIAGEDCYAPQELSTAARALGFAYVSACERLEDAASLLRGKGEGVLLIAGSLFLAGELLKNHG